MSYIKVHTARIGSTKLPTCKENSKEQFQYKVVYISHRIGTLNKGGVKHLLGAISNATIRVFIDVVTYECIHKGSSAKMNYVNIL